MSQRQPDYVFLYDYGNNVLFENVRKRLTAVTVVKQLNNGHKPAYLVRRTDDSFGKLYEVLEEWLKPLSVLPPPRRSAAEISRYARNHSPPGRWR